MTKDQKRKWLRALRSEKFLQGQGQLGSPSHGFCCLGVFCVVNGIAFVAPDAGMSSGPPALFQAIPNLETRWVLADLNDVQGKSFKQIATYVEKNVGPRLTAKR